MSNSVDIIYSEIVRRFYHRYLALFERPSSIYNGGCLILQTLYKGLPVDWYKVMVVGRLNAIVEAKGITQGLSPLVWDYDQSV